MKQKVKPSKSDWQQAINQYLQKNGFGQLVPKAVLFDMDGVLYDSMPGHALAWEKSMAKFGIRMTARDAYLTEGQRGVDTIKQMVRQQQGRDITEEEALCMYEEKSRLFHLMEETPVMPGIFDLMTQLQQQGIIIGIVTGSGQRPLIDRLTRDFAQFVGPENITTAFDTSRGKPFPDPYLTGLRKAGGLQPWEAVVVENAPLGVRAGVAAQIFTVAVNSGPLPDEMLAREGANMIFETMPEWAAAWPDFMSSLKD